MQIRWAAGLKVEEQCPVDRVTSRHEREIIPSSRGSHAIAGVLERGGRSLGMIGGS